MSYAIYAVGSNDEFGLSWFGWTPLWHYVSEHAPALSIFRDNKAASVRPGQTNDTFYLSGFDADEILAMLDKVSADAVNKFWREHPPAKKDCWPLRSLSDNLEHYAVGADDFEQFITFLSRVGASAHGGRGAVMGW
jgi:hypothetical protein